MSGFRFGRLLGFVFAWMLLSVPMGLFAQYVPPGSPIYSYQWYGNGPSCEYLFVGTFRSILPSPKKGTNMLLDGTGDLVWYHQGRDFTLDFKVHPNGLLSYSDRYIWHILDSNFVQVDSVLCVDRLTDHHELMVTEDGHYFIICREDSTMDVSALHTKNGTPGSMNAQVRMVVLQELDANKQLVKEWRGFDHYSIFDSDTNYFTNPGLLDLTHSNSIDLDEEGHVMVSHRHLNEVTLIDWNTGAIRWRLSGKNNDFDLLGDAGYYGQHDARFLPGGRISLFDNGNFHHLGRGLVLEVDTALWEARILGSYGDSIGSISMGSFRLLGDGSALMNLGEVSNSQDPVVWHYAADSTPVMSMRIHSNFMTYRAQCLDLPFALHRPRMNCTQQSGQVILGVDGIHGDYEWTTGETTATITVTDTGRYQVFVPYGIGMISSAPVYIMDLQNGCAAVGNDADVAGDVPGRPVKLIGRYDLMGQPVRELRAGQVYIERYSDGGYRKRVYLGD
jgi:hypothetical protein